MKPFEHLVFDLDDTLIDTNSQLVPHATREACEKMIAAGLRTDLATCMRTRDEIAQTPARKHLFIALAQKFGAPSDEIARIGERAFYDRKITEDLQLFPGVREMLQALGQKYSIHLVTSGAPETQEEKLDILKLKNSFDSISIVNTLAHETKDKAFAKIAPFALSIGNRLDTDIAPAKRLGWQTCWVKHGEYARSTPSTKDEKPDFTIATIQDLISTCRL